MTEKRKRPDEALKEIFDSFMLDLHFCLPGEVISFNAREYTVSVQPSLKRKYRGKDEAENIAIIEDVPVIMWGNGEFFICCDEIKKGTNVLLLFVERSIEKFMEIGGIVDPESTDKFDLSDAVAIPSILPKPNVLNPSPDASFSIRNSDNTAYIKFDAATKQCNINGNLTVDV